MKLWHAMVVSGCRRLKSTSTGSDISVTEKKGIALYIQRFIIFLHLITQKEEKRKKENKKENDQGNSFVSCWKLKNSFILVSIFVLFKCKLTKYGRFLSEKVNDQNFACDVLYNVLYAISLQRRTALQCYTSDCYTLARRFG